MLFNAPPGWPVPLPGWLPAQGWQPDPEWPPAPPGWTYLLPHPADTIALALRRRARILMIIGAPLVVLGSIATVAAGWNDSPSALDGVWWGSLAVGMIYLALGVCAHLLAPSRAERAVAKQPFAVVAVPMEVSA